jgi:transcriptional regulator with XRE-family HTH domain
MPKIIAFLGYCPWHSEPRSLAEKVVPTRRLLGLSQKKLARHLGVDPGTLGNWERDKRKPPQEMRRELFAFFNSHLPSARETS